MEQLTYGLLSITRKLGAHYVEKIGNESLLSEDAIAICLPFGNSQQDCIKLKFFNGMFYFSIIKVFSDNEGIGIISAHESIKDVIKNNFSIVIELYTLLKEKMNYTSLHLSSIQNLNIDQGILLKIDNVESALISLLINKKFFFLDQNFQILSFILELCDIFPKSFLKLVSFTINSKSYTENINLMSFSYSEINSEDLENMKNENNTIIDIQNYICFGNYSSPFFSSLMKNLREGNKTKVKDNLSLLESLVYTDKSIGIKKNNITKALKLSKTDVKLFEKIKLNLLEIPQSTNIFEELIK